MSVTHRLLEYLDQIKLYHWSTASHSRHVAADKLHKELQSNVDRFVEVYIGKYGRDVVLADGAVAKLKIYKDDEANQLLDDLSGFLMDEVPKHIDAKVDTDLLNIRDDILASVKQTKYLFTQHGGMHGGSMRGGSMHGGSMHGGSIFDMTFKMPILSFLYALLILMIISIFLALMVMVLFGVAWWTGLAQSSFVVALIAVLYSFLSLYAPLDYVYTMGINAQKN